MRYLRFFLGLSLFCWGWSQEKIELRYDFAALHQRTAQYKTRLVLEIEQKKDSAELKMKTTLEQIQKRHFQQDQTNPLLGKIDIQFEELWMKQDSEATLPDESKPQYSWTWKSNNPQQLNHQQLGPIPVKSAAPADRHKILQLQQMMKEAIQLHINSKGEIQQLLWPNISPEQIENFKKSWISLPNRPLSQGETWQQTFQENLSGLGLLQIQITYALKKIDTEKQIAQVVGYFHFTFNNTAGQNEKGVLTEFSEESGSLSFDFDLKNHLITNIYRELKMTLTIKVPTEGTEFSILQTKIRNQFQENIHFLEDNEK